ncbi:TetR/AcrR family transcriptional regulator [Vibrio breoganii]|uniref:TetR/AcrR family transcriptional regulator n=1 Tax=Vibrio breoganii TaxID=553239 RepID=UPI000C83D4CE|nr:TetR/AcrR family transcriptional regulator [Vibrio breoganii]PMG03450.1 TetR family transcriptional regulator [Vibrio breoganii]PMK30558.1 TetR family transcriptional regulator [Vibrio breoganii]PMK75956.1 TetR family transcriptional regulator [Vibrio breoganii]PML41053.1 TetR family transcriptional regulator [Vibrio breoganii]PMM12609.1 TetR family transcriptional regulator [Vibrio breoganii]
MGARLGTKQKIIEVAESLFAEKGFKDTSLRAITSQANVNLASVNYHFGDKKTLIRAVLDRYLEEFMPQLERELESIDLRTNVSMTDVFYALKTPLTNLDKEFDRGASRFLLLVGRGYSDVQGHLRWFITTRYGHVLDRFTQAVIQANPNLDKETLFWRLHFTLGTCVFTMASSEALLEIANSEFEVNTDVEAMFDQIVPFLASGMCAD